MAPVKVVAQICRSRKPQVVHSAKRRVYRCCTFAFCRATRSRVESYRQPDFDTSCLCFNLQSLQPHQVALHLKPGAKGHRKQVGHGHPTLRTLSDKDRTTHWIGSAPSGENARRACWHAPTHVNVTSWMCLPWLHHDDPFLTATPGLNPVAL